MTRSELEKEFLSYVKLGSELPPQTADNMLVAYGFYKQATEGDNELNRPTESSNVIQAFKHDAWKRLEGMPKEEAMKKYIAKIKELFEKED